MIGCATRLPLFLLFVLTFLFGAQPAISTVGCAETRYDVVAKGFRIGNMQTSLRNEGEGKARITRYENKTDVKASFLWIDYQLSVSERAVIKGENLVEYFRYGKEKGSEVKIEGRLIGDTFRFDVSENGSRHTVAVPRSSYDHTAMECPEATMDFGPSGRVSMRILDPSRMTVVNRSYRLVREDVYRVGDKQYPCRIVDLSDQNKSCRRWIGRDGDTIILFRQDGKGGRGSYSVRAVDVN